MTHATAPLAGTSVVVTRPAGPDALADALAAAGARVVALAAIEIAAPDDGGAALADAARAVSGYQWVAFSSANAVERFCAQLRDVRAFGRAHVAAVGEATADALRRHGVEPDLVPARASAEGLVDAFPLAQVPGAAVLFPAAADARPTLPQGLVAKGWRVDQVAAYRTVARGAPPPGAAAAAAGADAVVFASPSALEAYQSWRSEDGAPFPVPPLVVCIGPVTAAAARAAGLVVGAEAARPSPEALVDALAGALGGGEPLADARP